MVFNAITRIWNTFAVPDIPPRTFVFALTHQRFVTYCKQAGIQPYKKDVYGVSTENGIRGFRIDPNYDTVIKLCDFWMNPKFDEIRRSIHVASNGAVDLDAWPVTFT